MTLAPFEKILGTEVEIRNLTSAPTNETLGKSRKRIPRLLSAIPLEAELPSVKMAVLDPSGAIPIENLVKTLNPLCRK